MADLDVRVESTLGDHACAWDALVESMTLPSPFLRSWWVEATAAPGPHFVLALRGRTLVGGLALQEDRLLGVRRLRPAGSGPRQKAGLLAPDHLDVVAAPYDANAVAGALRAFFARSGPCLFLFDGVAEHAVAPAALPGRVRQEVVEAAPWSPLPGTFEEYLAQRPSQLRNSILRAGRRLERDGVTYRVADPADLDATLADLRQLHRLRFGQRSVLLPAYDDFARAAAAGSRSGEVVFHELVAGDSVIAIEVWFETARIGNFYQSGRDVDARWKGSGNVLKSRVIEALCAQGFIAIDLLRIDEPYKHAWVDEKRRLLRLESAVGWRARMVHAVLPFARWSNRAVRLLLRPLRPLVPALRARH